MRTGACDDAGRSKKVIVLVAVRRNMWHLRNWEAKCKQTKTDRGRDECDKCQVRKRICSTPPHPMKIIAYGCVDRAGGSTSSSSAPASTWYVSAGPLPSPSLKVYAITSAYSATTDLRNECTDQHQRCSHLALILLSKHHPSWRLCWMPLL